MEFILPQPLHKLKIIEVYEYYDRPILFACESLSGQKYLVNWIDTDELGDTWFYVPVSKTRFSMIRSGKLSLRECIIQAEDEFVWQVWISNQTDDVKLVIKNVNEIEEYDLPDEDSYLDLNEGTLPEKDNSVLESLRSKRDVLDISLEVEGTHSNEIETETLGSILLLTQELNYHVALKKQQALRGRIPNEIREKNKLKTVGFFAASFGVRLQSESTSGLLDFTDTTDSLESLINLFSSTNNMGTLKEAIKDINIRTTKTYYQLLKKLNEKNLEINLEWASPSSKSIKTRLEKNRIVDALRLMSNEQKVETSEIELSGNLVGLDTDKKTFHLISDENEHISGKFNSGLDTSQYHLPIKVLATLQQEVQLNNISDEENYKYVLTGLSIQP